MTNLKKSRKLLVNSTAKEYSEDRLDEILLEIVEKRDKQNAKFITHEQFWS